MNRRIAKKIVDACCRGKGGRYNRDQVYRAWALYVGVLIDTTGPMSFTLPLVPNKDTTIRSLQYQSKNAKPFTIKSGGVVLATLQFDDAVVCTPVKVGVSEFTGEDVWGWGVEFINRPHIDEIYAEHAGSNP